MSKFFVRWQIFRYISFIVLISFSLAVFIGYIVIFVAIKRQISSLVQIMNPGT